MKHYLRKLFGLIVVLVISFNNTVAQTTINLSSHVFSTPPSGSNIKWYADIPPPTNTSELNASQVANASQGTYYATFFSTTDNCYSPVSKLIVAINDCSIETVNLNLNTTLNTATGAGPGGSTLEWHTVRNPINPATKVVNPLMVTQGSYFAVYFLASSNLYTPTEELVVVAINRKIWNGSISSNWTEPLNWTPASIPTSLDYVQIPATANNPIISGSTDAYACTLFVKNGATLLMNSNNSITVTNQVIVEPTATFQIDNTGSLVQINDVTNIGNIIYKRTANVRNLDYVYWSSPVLNMNISSIINPLTFGPIYKWNPVVANTNGGEGDWQSAIGQNMQVAKGYIARSPSSFSPNVPQTLLANFIGIPNNGTINYTIERGTDTNTNYHQGNNGIEINNFSDNWNLLGNPYPSPIRASQFLFNNQSKIEGNVRLWTHGTLPSNTIPNPFYGSFIINYTANDYLTYNFTGTNCCPLAPDDLFIAAGQGFFVQMKDGPPATDIVSFNNGLRNNTYPNSNFFRSNSLNPASNTQVPIDIERNRIWLDISDSNGQTSRILFGYIQGATMDYDSFFDTYTLAGGPMSIFSINSNKKFIIQGRQLPFDVNDQVPIGVHLPNDGNYTISIAAVDGLFNTQSIYLQDQFLNIVHNLKIEPYSFYANANTINDRFKIIYLNNSLNTNSYNHDTGIQITTNTHINIKSNTDYIKQVIVYDILGRKLKEFKNINTKEITLESFQKTYSVLLVKVVLENDISVTQKVNF